MMPLPYIGQSVAYPVTVGDAASTIRGEVVYVRRVTPKRAVVTVKLSVDFVPGWRAGDGVRVMVWADGSVGFPVTEG